MRRYATLLLLAACGAPDTPTHEGPAAFTPAGDAWTTRSRPTGLVARFDSGGARFRGASGAAYTVGGAGGPWSQEGCEDRAECNERLVRERGPGLTEWWENRGEALEHGFVAETGGDSLTIDVPFQGAALTPDGDGVRALVPGTRGYRYAGLAAWDADGRALDARMEIVGESTVRLHVDTATAAWPVTVDPTLTPATWLTQSGTTYLGYWMAIVGDVNGDGYDDLAAGSSGSRVYLFHGGPSGPTYATSITTGGSAIVGPGDIDGDGYDDVVAITTGRTVSIHYGSASGLTTTAAATISLGSSSNSDGFAWKVGDTDADGYADVLLTQPGYDNGETNEGRAMLYRGGPTGLSTSAAWSYEGNVASASLGQSATGADVNGDGLPDLVIGAPGVSSNRGAVYVFHATSGGFGSSPDATIAGSSGTDYLGYHVVALPDADGDGDDEVALTTGTGTLWIQRGSPAGIPTSADQTVSGVLAGTTSGGLWYAGDLNGDGYGDLACGSTYGDGLSTDSGLIELRFGSAAGFAATADVTISGTGPLRGFGLFGAGGGDLDGDGYDDFVASEYLYSSAGRLLVTYGAAGGALDTAWTASDVRRGSTSGGYFGSMLAGAGDVNADGQLDLAVGASGSKVLSVYHGGSTGLDATAATSITRSEQYFSTIAPAAGDFDGDGYGDLLVGSYTYQSSSATPVEGAAFVYEGGLTGVSSTAAWTMEINAANAYFGSSVAAGDFDGDGYDDAAVGASHHEIGQTDEGVVYLYEGGPSGLASAASWYWDPDVASAVVGSAAAAGDLDGDGFDDLAVAGTSYGATYSREGAVFLFEGGAGGLGATEDWSATGGQASAYCGNGLTMVGDVDGDGYGELAFGCYGYDDSVSDTGRVVVYAGSATGLGSSPAFAWSPDQTNVQAGRVIAGGDVDGDGFADLAVGAPNHDVWATDEGQVWLFPGGASGLDAADPYTFTAWDPSGYFGSALAIVDTDGDGDEDLHVGLPYADGSYSSTTVGEFLVWDLGDLNADTDGDGDPDATDCDDADASVHAGAPEACDGVDDDCDGAIDEETPTWYADADADGYGDAASTVTTCTAPAGYVAAATDCDDADAAVNPDAGETCDGLDDDCDGAVDEDGEAGEPTWYADADGDGYGDASDTMHACAAPSGAVSDATDCDDTDAGVSPGAPESCDGADEDCDGVVDDAAFDAPSWYADADGDGYGDPADTAVDCSVPAGYVADATDCDDTDAAVSPAGVEACDGADDDCDGAVDDGVLPTWYADVDGDGAGGTAISTEACSAPVGFVATATDCDDADAAVYPGAAESCDGADQDCDGSVDEGATRPFYADADGDGFGDVSVSTSACSAPTGFVENAFDCDDTRADVNPDATETCNGVDDDCDAAVDPDDADGAPWWYVDGDGDGYGRDSDPVQGCLAPGGRVDAGGDCDDTDATISPGATETWYDGVDQDCAGDDDDDADGDGHAAEIVGGDDCDDTDADVSPDAAELWYDGIDQDCAADDDYDADGDGQASESWGGDDCDDADPAVYTGAPDVPYDGVVADCSHASDYDADGDGFDARFGGGDDCDDARSDTHPGAAEVWYDGVDQDCDGNDSDQDADGYALGLDCDDTDSDVHPGEEDVPGDGVDQDCDGSDAAEAGSDGSEDGCGCGASPREGGLLPLVGVLVVGLRRRGRGSHG